MSVKLVSYDLYGEWLRFICELPKAKDAVTYPKITVRARDVVTYTSGRLVKNIPTTSHPYTEIELGVYKATLRLRNGDKWDFEFEAKDDFYDFIDALDRALTT